MILKQHHLDASLVDIPVTSEKDAYGTMPRPAGRREGRAICQPTKGIKPGPYPFIKVYTESLAC